MVEFVLPPETRVATGAYGEIEGDLRDELVHGTYMRTSTWSPELVALLQRLLHGGGTLLDVGAHIGLIAIAVARERKARCLAFEPAPENYALLCRNVRRQGLQRFIEPHALALDAKSGTARLALSDDNSGDHRLQHHPRAGARRSVKVHCARLDEVLAKRRLPAPIVMKLDTQGAEVRVLAGAAETLPRVSALVLEYWPAGLHRMGNRAAQLHALLRAHFGYAAVLEQNPGPLRLRPAAQVLDELRFIRDDGSDQGFFDLLLSRHPEPF